MYTTTRHRTLGLVATVMLGSALLAGCTTEPSDDPTADAPTASSTPTDTPTPTPTVDGVDAPADDAAAQREATDVLQAEIAAVNKVLQNKGEGADELAQYATGPQLEALMNAAEAIRLDGVTRTGDQVLTVLSGYSAPLSANGTEIPNGTVTLTVCNDISQVNATAADGSPAPQPDYTQSTDEVEIVYSPTDRTWFVRNTIQVAKTC